MNWVIGGWTHLGVVSGKAALMYATALLGLRLGERRTFAQWTIVDVVTAVAIGAIVGRTAVASSQAFVGGAVAVATLIVIHRVVSLLRFQPTLQKALDHRTRVLVSDGQIRVNELKRCGLTESDLYTQLRQQGVFSLVGLRYVLYEATGNITVVPDEVMRTGAPELVTAGVEGAAGYTASTV